MKQHPSAQQVEQWVTGERRREVEQHLQTCRACAEEIQRMEELLKLFGSAVRNWGEEMRPARSWNPNVQTDSVSFWFGVWRSRVARVALAVCGAVAVIAVPVYQQEQRHRQAAAAAVQDEILLREVESGISRSVPAPMEPLAKLMSNDLSR